MLIFCSVLTRPNMVIKLDEGDGTIVLAGRGHSTP